MGEVSIRTEKLTKTYRSGDRELVVFADLDLEVVRGERLALTGASGAGKSTLLYLLGGLDRPSAGKIYFGQTELTQATDRELAEYRNRSVGFVWQNHSLLPEFTALENVMMPLLIRGVSAAEARLEARGRLEEVGLSERTTHRAGELSGGEQQRVALARALAPRPALLLADEPTGNLDARTGQQIIQLLEEVQRRDGLTLVYVTHNPAFADRADRVLNLEIGVGMAGKPAVVGGIGGKMDPSAGPARKSPPGSGGSSIHV
jgi:lipoprotein-releasing system ATP-binding protein